MKILVTGAAGFIGHFTVLRLLSEGHTVVGIDQVNDYYASKLKIDRLRAQGLPDFTDMDHFEMERYSFFKADLEDQTRVDSIFRDFRPDVVIHLAAQAGVRYSLENPRAYVSSNISGFLNILEGCRHFPVQHLIYASSSSVYGSNKTMPFKTSHSVDHPVSLYAATKKSNELMAHTYSHLYQVPTTGLRFFTVYGPWGRPDMAYFSFTKAILSGEPIKVFNEGKMMRDFTYIDDIVESMVRLIPSPPTSNPDWNADQPDPGTSYAPYRVCNIGCNNPVNLLEFIEEIEQALGKKAEKIYLPMQPGDVVATWADVSNLIAITGHTPSVTLREGVSNFVAWYKSYYQISI